MTYLHPFADADMIVGYATMGVEIIEDIPNNVDVLLVPTGGGGLLAGVSSYFKNVSPSTKIVGVEPENANPMYLSLSKDKIVSVESSRYCDGSSVKMISKIAFDICKYFSHYIDLLSILLLQSHRTRYPKQSCLFILRASLLSHQEQCQ